MASIVISYRRDDSKWTADLIFNRLESHYGKGNVFMDIDSIPFGLDFRDHIRDTLDRCDVMVALVGPNWIGRDTAGDHILDETDWVRIEIEAALNKKIPLIPLLIDGSRMPKPDELPEALKNFVFRQSAAIDRDNFRAQMDKVIASIDQHLSALQAREPAAPIQKSVPPAESATSKSAPVKVIAGEQRNVQNARPRESSAVKPASAKIQPALKQPVASVSQPIHPNKQNDAGHVSVDAGKHREKRKSFVQIVFALALLVAFFWGLYQIHAF